MQACTIVARNYVPHARVLARSFREHHPDGEMYCLVIDDPDAGATFADEPFEPLGPYDIGLDRAELHRMVVMYDVKELATALKPALLRTLLGRGDHIAYFDPDIEFFASVEEVAELAREHAIVLTPHVTTPIPRDGRLPDDRMILRAGIYNLGFISVGAAAGDFLDWWAERLARDCIVDIANALFVDQRWVDFVPALFPHVVLRDPGYNVAYWNLYERELTDAQGGYQVNGSPLRFFHFSGFAPGRPDVLSGHMGDNPRLRVSAESVLGRLCRAYGERLTEDGYTTAQGAYGWDELPNGAPVDAQFRKLYRGAVLAAEEQGDEMPPDPIDEPDAAVAWLYGPGIDGALPPILESIWTERSDLRAAFPDVRGVDRNRFLVWAASSAAETGVPVHALPPLEGAGRRTAQIESRLRAINERHGPLDFARPAWRWFVGARLAARRRRAAVPASAERPLVEIARQPRRGFTVAGYFHAELGVGEAARRLLVGIEHAGIPHSTIAYRRTINRQQQSVTLADEGRALHRVNVVCVNADQLPVFAADVGSAFFRNRHTVGLWFWEVARFPETQHEAFRYVDEVWVASDFVREAVAAETEKDVFVVPLPVVAPAPSHLGRADVGLPRDRFVFLFSFDFMSVLERKNPLGLIEAYTRAFDPDDGAHLLIKTINGHHRPDDLRVVRQSAWGRDDIEVRDAYVTSAERDALTAACDCYVSLHRSEGYGLTMAEAMALGKPVVATGYSGNMSFMDETNSVLVPYSLVPIPEGAGPYPAGVDWAEPDVEVAAAELRRLFEDPRAAAELGHRARADVLRRRSPDACGVFLSDRLDAIEARRMPSRAA